MNWKSLVFAVALGSALVPCSQASVISVNFQGGRSPATGPDVTDTAGYLPVGNWNNATGTSGTLSNLSDASGINSGASITWNTWNLWDLQNGDGNGGDLDMMSGYLDNFGASPANTISISDIPYASYNVFVYFNRGNPTYSGLTANDGSGGVTLYGLDNGSTYAENGYLISEDDNVGDGWTTANVFKFSGFTGSTLTLDDPVNPGAPGDWKVYIQGIQIQVIPEPSTLALLGAGGGAMLLAARRRNKTA